MERYTKQRKLSVKSFLPIIIIVLVAGALQLWAYLRNPSVPTAQVPAVTREEVIDALPPEPTPPPAPSPDTVPELPQEFNLAVPFASQAPFGVWDAFHEETCEEASFYMVSEFYKGNTAPVLDPEVTDDVYHRVVDWETSQGLGLSITAAESVVVLKSQFGFAAKVVENPTIEEIREYVRDGQPVIMPAAGRKLGNPFFTGEGPLYHMLVIRGYTEDEQFITNDPGTRHGQNYTYSASVIMEAMGDWNNGDPEHGAKRIVVVSPD